MTICMPFLGYVLFVVLFFILALLAMYRTFDVVTYILQYLRPYSIRIIVVLLLIQITLFVVQIATGTGCS